MNGKRLMFTGERQSKIETFEPSAQLGWGECMLRVSHSLISPGTELAMYREARAQAMCPGYTAVGQVVRAGEGLESLAGQRVFCFPVLSDSTHCHASHKRVAREGILLPLPEGMDPGQACFARMINVALTPYAHLDASIAGWAVVVGLGLVGNIAAQLARLKGFNVIGLDPDAARRKRAQDVGVGLTLDPGAGDVVAEVKRLTGGRGANLTINATGVAATFGTAISCTADGGELSTLGGARGEATMSLTDFLRQVQFRHVTVRGGWEMTLPRRSSPALQTPSTEAHLAQALAWLKEGRIDVRPLWTHTIRPDALPDAYRALDKADPGYLGVVVDWS